jgi:uncharacterized membrane protein YbaN (DUF454 family)
VPHHSRAVRILCLGSGILALTLAILGIFLPLLPTTPFILLAAACFARSSNRLHDWLLTQPVAGPVIRDWQDYRSMPPRVKPWATLLILLSFSLSIWLMDSDWHRIMLGVLMAALLLALWRIPVRDATSEPPPAA